MYYDSSNKMGYWGMVAITVALFILPFLLGSVLLEHLFYGIVFIPLSVFCNMQTAKRYLIDCSGLTIFRFIGKTMVTYDQITLVTKSTVGEISPGVITTNKNTPVIMIEVKKHNKRYFVSAKYNDEFINELGYYVDIERINEIWDKTIGEQY